MIFDQRFLHPYSDKNDLNNVLSTLGEWNTLTNFCGYLHPGDVAHFLSNTLRGQNIDKHLYIYEDSQKHVLALLLLYPTRFSSYNVLIHPQYWGTDLHTRLLLWSEQEVWARIQAEDNHKTWIDCETTNCDTALQNLLLAQGYKPASGPSFYNTIRSLEDSLPECSLPAGFSIRNVAGEHEVEALCEVHNSAFNSKWQANEYLKVMRAPGFHSDRELVVVAPDGRFAAFLIYWIDPVTRCGLFEPVGCHEDFRRRGLTRALIAEGMRRMVAHGMTRAMVNHQAPEENPASTALYRSVGFSTLYTITSFRKQMR